MEKLKWGVFVAVMALAAVMMVHPEWTHAQYTPPNGGGSGGSCGSLGGDVTGTCAANTVTKIQNVAVSNSGFGLNSTTTMPNGANTIGNNAFFGNTSGARNNISARPGDVTLSGNPFTNSAGNDFSLNTGAGAALKAAGIPGVLAIGGTGYLDIGALQHQSVAGGGISGSPIQ